MHKTLWGEGRFLCGDSDNQITWRRFTAADQALYVKNVPLSLLCGDLLLSNNFSRFTKISKIPQRGNQIKGNEVNSGDDNNQPNHNISLKLQPLI